MKLDDKDALKKLRIEIDKALAPVAEALGLTTLRAGNISYEANGLAAKITVKAECVSADGKTKEEVDFERLADIYDLKPEWLHKHMWHGNRELEIVGLCISRSKFPVLVRDCRSGKKVLITIEEVQRKFGKPRDEHKTQTPIIGGLELVPPPPRTGGA